MYVEQLLQSTCSCYSESICNRVVGGSEVAPMPQSSSTSSRLRRRVANVNLLVVSLVSSACSAKSSPDVPKTVNQRPIGLSENFFYGCLDNQTRHP